MQVWRVCLLDWGPYQTVYRRRCRKLTLHSDFTCGSNKFRCLCCLDNPERAKSCWVLNALGFCPETSMVVKEFWHYSYVAVGFCSVNLSPLHRLQDTGKQRGTRNNPKNKSIISQSCSPSPGEWVSSHLTAATGFNWSWFKNSPCLSHTICITAAL